MLDSTVTVGLVNTILFIAGLFLLIYAVMVTVMRYDDYTTIPTGDEFVYYGGAVVGIIGVALIVMAII